MNNEEIMTLYLKAYTSKKAADSVADDIAVGTGSGLLGGLMGYAGGAIRGEKLRQTKYPKIEDALNRIRARTNKLEPKVKNVRKDLLRRLDLLTKAKYDELPTSWLDPLIEKDKASLNKLEPALKNNKKRYFKTWRKVGKLQKAIKNSRRIGGVAGAVGAGVLSTILYNKLKES